MSQCPCVVLGEVASEGGFGQQTRHRQHRAGEATELAFETFGVFGRHFERVDGTECALAEAVGVRYQRKRVDARGAHLV